MFRKTKQPVKVKKEVVLAYQGATITVKHSEALTIKVNVILQSIKHLWNVVHLTLCGRFVNVCVCRLWQYVIFSGTEGSMLPHRVSFGFQFGSEGSFSTLKTETSRKKKEKKEKCKVHWQILKLTVQCWEMHMMYLMKTHLID